MRILAFAALLAAPVLAQVTVVRDVAYGDHRLQRMDVYVPDPQPTNAPVVAMVHGGAWFAGDKTNAQVWENKVKRWVPRGWVVVSINTRLLPEADPLAQAQDVARALAAIQKDARSWGADASKLVLMGHSSGGHLVALLAANPAGPLNLGAKPWLGTVVLDNGVYDLPAIMGGVHVRHFDLVFTFDGDYWKRMSPVHLLTARATPMLLVCSKWRVDSCGQARDFVEAAEKLGVRSETLEVNLSHRDINDTLGLDRPYTRRVEAFLASLDPAFR